MDQLTACLILDVEPDSSREEIKASYAEMVKQYHPEEHPKEFAEIQEAYQFMLKESRRRRTRRQTGEDERTEDFERKMRKERHVDDMDAFLESRFRQVDQREDLRQQEEEARKEEEKARKEAQALEKKREEEEMLRRQQDTIQWAAQYLETIMRDPSLSGKPEAYSRYFLVTQVREVMDCRNYIRALLRLLDKYPQKPKIYRLLRKIYRNRPDDILKKRLMIYLDEKLDVDTDKKFSVVLWSIIAVLEIWGVIRNIGKPEWMVMVVLYIVFDLITLGYMRMRRSYCFRTSQICAFLAYLAEVTVCAFGEVFSLWRCPGGFNLMVLIWFFCLLWLVILGIWSAVASVRGWIERKKSRSA